MLQTELIRTWAGDFLNAKNQFITELKIGSDAHIQICIDGVQAITLADCIQLSRYLESHLDRDQCDFRLDVSSPGATSPLTDQRQYAKHVGRTLHVTLDDGRLVCGNLSTCSDTEITLTYSVREPKPVGKGNHTVHKSATIPFSQIRNAVVQLPFQ